MTTNNKETIYLAPEVEVTEIAVERGFSNTGTLEDPEFDEDI